MKKNQKVVVSDQHPHWPGREGYFFAMAQLGARALLSPEPVPESDIRPRNVFAVHVSNIQAVE